MNGERVKIESDRRAPSGVTTPREVIGLDLLLGSQLNFSVASVVPFFTVLFTSGRIRLRLLITSTCILLHDLAVLSFFASPFIASGMCCYLIKDILALIDDADRLRKDALKIDWG
jgi:hypothetical protein